jgi:hypothetical protein
VRRAEGAGLDGRKRNRATIIVPEAREFHCARLIGYGFLF